jgi:hypothetical protein
MRNDRAHSLRFHRFATKLQHASQYPLANFATAGHMPEQGRVFP